MEQRQLTPPTSDIWAGLRDAKERRKRQNRLNKRAERHRRGSTSTSAKTSIKASSIETVPFKNGGVFKPTIPSHNNVQYSTTDAIIPKDLVYPGIPNIGCKRLARNSALECLMCWTRRIKCDGTSPTCSQSISMVLREPYPSLSSSKIKPQLLAAQLASPHTHTPLYLASTSSDRQMFFNLRTIALQTLAGPFDSRFWTVDAVLAIQTYPAAWHAGLALASAFNLLQVDKLSTTRRRQEMAYILHHYNKAIRCLLGITRQTTKLSVMDMEALLLTSILFVGICSLQKDICSALVHLENGLKAFHSWDMANTTKATASSTGVNTILGSQSLITLFSRFDLQFATGGPQRAGRCWRIDFDLVMPDRPFTSVTEAYFEFIPLQNSLCKSFFGRQEERRNLGQPIMPCDVTPPAISSTNRWLFNSWRQRFTSFINSQEYHGSDDLEAILTLQIWSITLGILLALRQSNNGQPDELAYDAHLSAFELVVDLVQKLYDEFSTRDMDIETRARAKEPIFSYSPSVCEALLFVMSCRDGNVRRRTINLLRKWPRTDGIWDPRLVATILESHMVYEESYTMVDQVIRSTFCRCIPLSYICGFHRVTRTLFIFLQEGTCQLSLLIDTTELPIKRQTRHDVIIYW